MALSLLEQRMAGIERGEADIRRERRALDFKERERDIREGEANVFDDARRRRLESQNLTALGDPGRYAPQVYNQAKQWRDQNRFQQHELDMLDKRGEWDVKREEAHAQGLRGQGAEAAGISANANLEIAKQGGLTQAEIARINGETQRDVAKIGAGSALDVEKQRGLTQKEIASINADATKYGADAQVDAQKERNKGLQSQAEINRQAEEFKFAHQKELAELRLRGKLPTNAEIMAWSKVKKEMEEKGITFSQWLLNNRNPGAM